jgi:photosystem II stability/assembly factor-like uncharacterized protein
MKTRVLIATAIALLTPLVGAQTWEKVSFPVPENITGLCFLNSSTGYAVTSGAAVASTTDGGKTWTAGRMKYGIPLEDVCFRNKDTGYVCGRKGLLSRTVDGGAVWEDRSIEDSTAFMISIRPLDAINVLALGLVRDSTGRISGVAYRSIDGGKKWTKLPDMGLGFGELFYRPGSPICFQSWGLLHYSTDLGATWQSRPTTQGKPGRATAFYAKTGVICGNNGMAAYTADGGTTWNQVNADEAVSFTSVALVNDKLGYMAGTGGTIMKTVDGGKTWAQETVPVTFDIYELCLAGRYLYAAGKDGNIIRTSVEQGPSVKPGGPGKK